mmetsp:Transcript_26354/g.52567  ORF Transcript_26354/g.52567 Transcript_26354/m.52567 type:complete len:399 (+) Transcript_26354:1-1197(+)
MEIAAPKPTRLDVNAAQPPAILLIASKDEPYGIRDDAGLQLAFQRALGTELSLRWCLWDDMPHNWREEQQSLPVIRSLWEGRNAHGATAELRKFLQSLAIAVPQLAADYELILWIVHKRYLLQLARLGVPIVPTVLTRGEIKNAGDLKREMEKLGWVEAVLKPACGTRCEGVLRLSIAEWSLRIAMEVAKLLRDSEGDCLLQPLLAPCRQRQANGSSQPGDGSVNIEHWGEVCVLFINGKIVHAVHKTPSKWGWHRAHCPCSFLGEALAGAECECDSLGSTRGGGSGNIGSGTSSSATAKPDVAPVQQLPLPLPGTMEAAAMAAATALPRADELMLFRVDLLPRFSASGRIEWLVSEVEGQWCECFLRGGAEEADTIAAAVMERHAKYRNKRKRKRSL